MAGRRFFSNQENHSFNLTGGERTMLVSHPSEHISMPSQDRRAYTSYTAFCRKLSLPALPFEVWLKTSERLDKGAGNYSSAIAMSAHSSAVDRNQQRFHQRDMAYDNFRGVYEPARREWSGSWDNAVRAVEG